MAVWCVVGSHRAPEIGRPCPLDLPDGCTSASFGGGGGPGGSRWWYVVRCDGAAARLALFNRLNGLPAVHDPDDGGCGAEAILATAAGPDGWRWRCGGCGAEGVEGYDDDGWVEPLETAATRRDAEALVDGRSWDAFVGGA